jgi:hypothetical protein
MKKKNKETIFHYEAMPGGVLSKKEAIVAGAEFERITETHGAIKPQTVVDESEPESAPLHGHFTWDDGIAANKYRCDEASRIIRSVRIVRDGTPAAEQEVVRALVHVKAHDNEESFSGNGYIGMAKAMSDDEYRNQLLLAARCEIASWERRYADLLHFFKLEDKSSSLKGAIDKKIKKMAK